MTANQGQPTWTTTTPRPPMTVACYCGDVGLPERGSCGDERCVEPRPLTEAAQQAIANIRRDLGQT